MTLEGVTQSAWKIFEPTRQLASRSADEEPVAGHPKTSQCDEACAGRGESDRDCGSCQQEHPASGCRSEHTGDNDDR